VKESGEAGREIAELMTPAIISSVEGDRPAFDGSPEEEQGHRQQLKQEAALLENKVRSFSSYHFESCFDCDLFVMRMFTHSSCNQPQQTKPRFES
jgi:hypothetical protein